MTTKENTESLRSIPDQWADPPKEWVATIPRGGVNLSYLGHADTTLALIQVDPEWTLDLGWETSTGPVDCFALSNPSQPTIILARLTVLGVTRPCVGTVASWKGPDSLKELMGDAIRNGAMRFGIATGLWSKAQRDGHDPDARPGKPKTNPDWHLNQLKHAAMGLVTERGLSREIASTMFAEVVGSPDAGATWPPGEAQAIKADFVKWRDAQ